MSSNPKSRSCFHWSCNKLDRQNVQQHVTTSESHQFDHIISVFRGRVKSFTPCEHRWWRCLVPVQCTCHTSRLPSQTAAGRSEPDGHGVHMLRASQSEHMTTTETSVFVFPYLSVKRVALSTLGEPSDDVLKAVHGRLHLWWVVSSIRLSVLETTRKKNKQIKSAPLIRAATHVAGSRICYENYTQDSTLVSWLTRAKHFWAWARAESGLSRMHSSKSTTASSTWSSRIFSWEEMETS